MEPWILLAGLVLQTVVFLAGGYGMVLRSGWSATALQNQVISMQEELKKLTEVVINQAVHTTRLDNQGTQIALIQKDIFDLRRGVGWAHDRRSGVDGEYK